MIDKTVVDKLDYEKHLDNRRELARSEQLFERGLVGVTATYSYHENGKITAINKEFKEILDGQKSAVIGKTKVPNSNIPSRLKVSFFWFFYGDYFVLDLEDNYQWAAVGSSSDKYL